MASIINAIVGKKNMVSIKAKVGSELVFRFEVPYSATLSDLTWKVIKRICPKYSYTFRFKYHDHEGDLVYIICDEDLEYCFRTMTSTASTATIKMDVSVETMTLKKSNTDPPSKSSDSNIVKIKATCKYSGKTNKIKLPSSATMDDLKRELSKRLNISNYERILITCDEDVKHYFRTMRPSPSTKMVIKDGSHAAEGVGAQDTAQ